MLRLNLLHLVSGRPGLSVACKALPCNRSLSDRLVRPPSDNSEPIDLRTCKKSEIKRLLGVRYRQRGQSSSKTMANINFLGTGGNELEPSFIVNCDSRTYLFNSGEGWMRMATSHSCRMAQRPITFFTRASWENCGGSLGVYFMLDNKFDKRPYLGPKKIQPIMSYIGNYAGSLAWNNIKGLGESMRSGEPFLFEDDNIVISMIDIDPVDSSNDTGTVVAYSCKLADVRGKFFPEKAIELGVTEGPAFSVLTDGKSVITKEGNLVHPHQVMAETRKGDSFLVVDCPSECFMDVVTTNQYLQPEHYAKQDENLVLVVHITPLDILQHEDYCKWMASFGEGTKHIFLHSTICPGEVGHRATVSFSLPFHLTNPNMYSLPRIPPKNTVSKSDLNITKYVSEDSVTIGKMFMKCYLKPEVQVDFTDCLGSVEDQVKRELSIIDENLVLKNRILHHRQRLAIEEPINTESVLSHMTGNLAAVTLDDPDDALVTFLGTSSGVASKIRISSGILVQTPTAGNIMLECGEGTLHQLYNCFGVDRTRDILRNIKLIFISHAHPDHHFGLVGLLNEIQALTRDDPSHIVTVVSEKQFRTNIEVPGVYKAMQVQHVSGYDIIRGPFPCGGGVSITTVPVPHMRQSYGCILRKEGAWQIVFSGDTPPSERLVKEGRNATLLIHEATFPDELLQQAMVARHCTYSEAVEMGVAMKANFTLTTHFTPRSSWFPLMAKYRAHGTSPAFDFMTVRLSDISNQQLDSVSCSKVFNSLVRHSLSILSEQ